MKGLADQAARHRSGVRTSEPRGLALPTALPLRAWETRLSSSSKIEWTDATWNPVRGCTKISPGCKHCYAETFAERFRGVPGHPYEQGFDLRLIPEKLAEPLQWNAPRRVFVNSMSDLFHKDIPEDYLVSVARVMQEAPWHTFQVLTKRSDRLLELLQGPLRFVSGCEHIWWGVSVEDREYGVPRIEHLRAAPARIRFLSIEPLLESLGELNLEGIHGVIVGGESGAKARRLDPTWVKSIRDQCQRAGVKFFFKQWGGVRKHQTGRELEGRTYDELPASTSAPIPERPQRLRVIERLGLAPFSRA